MPYFFTPFRMFFSISGWWFVLCLVALEILLWWENIFIILQNNKGFITLLHAASKCKKGSLPIFSSLLIATYFILQGCLYIYPYIQYTFIKYDTFWVFVFKFKTYKFQAKRKILEKIGSKMFESNVLHLVGWCPWLDVFWVISCPAVFCHTRGAISLSLSEWDDE